MQGIHDRQARLLLRVLDCLEYETPDKEPLFALTGGAALNFFAQPLPRLSVNIDLAYCPLDEQEPALAAMRSGLQHLTQVLCARLSGAQCEHTQHEAGDHLLVRHNGVTVKVEPGGFVRGAVFPTETRRLCQEARLAYKTTVSARCLSEADLYGGKICAALDRHHPRDYFDLLPLKRRGVLDEKIRKAFLAYALSHPRPLAELLDPHPPPMKEKLRAELSDMTHEPVSMKTLEHVRTWILQAIRTGLTPDERWFLRSVEAEEPIWALAGLPAHVPHLPAVRRKLQNMAELRQHPEKHKESLAKLEKSLFSSAEMQA